MKPAAVLLSSSGWFGARVSCTLALIVSGSAFYRACPRAHAQPTILDVIGINKELYFYFTNTTTTSKPTLLGVFLEHFLLESSCVPTSCRATGHRSGAGVNS